jgi:hypothetical protein
MRVQAHLGQLTSFSLRFPYVESEGCGVVKGEFPILSPFVHRILMSLNKVKVTGHDRGGH